MVEDCKMSTVTVRNKAREKFLKLNGIKGMKFDPGDTNQNCIYPPNTIPLENQVAGHSFGDGKNTLGMLKHKDGYVLKPIEKPHYGEREIKFYEDLQSATDNVSVGLRKFVPKYLGTTALRINEKDVKFIKLDDIAKEVAEPCIMDIKIGRQTWDPEATLEKRKNEDQKYAECKQDLGFCIPGFQVHSISTGNVLKFGKEYGKKLNKTTIRDGGGQSYNGIDPFVEIPDTSMPHVDLNCSSELKSDDFVVVNDVMDVVEFDNVCIKEEPQKYLLQEEQELEQEDLLQYQKQREPPQHQQQCQQDKSPTPRSQRRDSEFKRQHNDCRNPEALSQCLQIISRHDEKCACALHMLRMKFEEEKLQTEHEFWEERLRTERELREERKHTERELRQKQLQTEDLRQKHLAELHELEIKERILKIHFLQERLRKS